MRRYAISFAYLLLAANCVADDAKPAFPVPEWEHIAKPEAAGFSSAKLDVLRQWMKTQNTSAMMVTVGGRVCLITATLNT